MAMRMAGRAGQGRRSRVPGTAPSLVRGLLEKRGVAGQGRNRPLGPDLGQSDDRETFDKRLRSIVKGRENEKP